MHTPYTYRTIIKGQEYTLIYMYMLQIYILWMYLTSMKNKKIGKPIKENYYKNRLDLEAWH